MKAIELAAQQAGSISALARAVGVSHQVANRWVLAGFAPLKRAKQIGALYGLPIRELVSPKLLDLIDESSFV